MSITNSPDTSPTPAQLLEVVQGSPTPAQLLEVVQGSPTAVSTHDRTAWLKLFSPNAIVEDPVGSRPRRGWAELGAFWDAFIAPNRIEFAVEHDEIWPRLGGGTVMRDLSLSTEIGGAQRIGPVVVAPMHLRYEVVTSENTLTISSLRAHWSQPALSAALLTHGIQGMSAGGRMAARLVHELGIGGSLGFARGSIRPSILYSRRATRILTSLGAGELAAAKKLCSTTLVRTGDGAELGPEQTIQLLAGSRVGKTIAAGNSITMSVHRPHGGGRGVVEYRIPGASPLPGRSAPRPRAELTLYARRASISPTWDPQ